MTNIVNLDIKQLLNDVIDIRSDYSQTNLMNQISEQFKTEDQQLFAKSFLLYTSFPKDTCLINLDNVYKWMGFSRKDHAKRLLLNPKFKFKEGVDFTIKVAPQTGGASSEDKLAPQTGGASFKEETQIIHGGQNEQIMLTPNCFKKMCLKANTDRSDQIHDYYIHLEEMVHNNMISEKNKIEKELLDQVNQAKLGENRARQDAFTLYHNQKILINDREQLKLINLI